MWKRYEVFCAIIGSPHGIAFFMGKLALDTAAPIASAS